jgi:hypothetical protein
MKIESVVFTSAELTDIIETYLKQKGFELSNPNDWTVLECTGDCEMIVVGAANARES